MTWHRKFGEQCRLYKTQFVYEEYLDSFSYKALFLKLVRIPAYFLILWRIFLMRMEGQFCSLARILSLS